MGTGVVKPIAVRGGLSAADQTRVADRGVAVIAWSVGSDLVGARLIDLGCTGVAPDPAISSRVGERAPNSAQMSGWFVEKDADHGSRRT